MKNNHGLALIYLLLPLTIFTLFAIGGMVVWNKTAVSPATTIIERIKETLPIPEEEKTKMPWEDSVCGNGICERCESRNECCNYPCITDPITGNQVCPPPTCLGWCPQDCQDGFKNTNALESCLKEAENLRKRVCEEMKIPLDEHGNCVGVDFVKDPYQECYDKYGQK